MKSYIKKISKQIKHQRKKSDRYKEANERTKKKLSEAEDKI